MSNSENLFRHELKYYISQPVYNILRNRIAFLLRPDSNTDENNSYTVSSLYFDDAADSAYYEKLDGYQMRKKFRIRVYNGDDGLIRLEKKSKNSSYILKHSGRLSRADYEGIIAGNAGSFVRADNGVIAEMYKEMLFNYLRPKVIVEYDREAYIGECSELRVTFDKDLRVVYNSLDLFESSNAYKQVLPDGMLVLEVKFNSILPEHIRQVIAEVDKHSLAISKYVLCRDKYNEIKGI